MTERSFKLKTFTQVPFSDNRWFIFLCENKKKKLHQSEYLFKLLLFQLFSLVTLNRADLGIDSSIISTDNSECIDAII